MKRPKILVVGSLNIGTICSLPTMDEVRALMWERGYHGFDKEDNL